ncbi:putative mitochondrial F1F0 ATP synthase subunit Atp18 [Piedraia hortae CBS 480.64]|uniref:Putative mitochondrial F1F0 ATP synthase subunit Atp18 n=1 Tax=Piedraia hortae CBS 480.64 TaxID=1314780 RepID=A0A6A7C3A4_9PEZI|nr:putative mitochondrial F1F0 ATP synthase subunit Atp18 [Piedraia hortae CBS 480.64]
MLGKKFPTPVIKPYWPFMAAGALVLYGVNSVANAMMNSEEFKNDPRNPHRKTSRGH